VPDPVVDRARELLDEEEGGDETAADARTNGHGETARANGHGARDAASEGADADAPADLDADALDELQETNLAATTPLEALELLSRLKRGG
jgi:DNA mismatch repair protein MutS